MNRMNLDLCAGDVFRSSGVAVLIIDDGVWLMGIVPDWDTALTLMAIASEDPVCWNDIAGYWPRYVHPGVPEFADGLPLEPVADRSIAWELLQAYDLWMSIDLDRRRICTSPASDCVGRDQIYAMSPDETIKPEWFISIHLPPWWELIEQTTADSITASSLRGAEKVRVPRPGRVDRNVLFGAPVIEDLSRRILAIANSKDFRESDSHDGVSLYRWTVQVHRDWLMTPRDDLDGRKPRDLLHGAIDWIDRIIDGQRLRVQDGIPPVAIPTDVTGFETAPMGREEVVIYFDYCRYLIGQAWLWCEQRFEGQPVGDIENDRHSQDLEQLQSFLRERGQLWLAEPNEMGSAPEVIVQCSRCRVPMVIGTPIDGMEGTQVAGPELDCNCPICSVMADQSVGVGFTMIDGHHLELDSEFAFSLCQTYEQWQDEQLEYAKFIESFEHDSKTPVPNRPDAADGSQEDDATGANKQGDAVSDYPISGQPSDQPDEFASVWTSTHLDGPIPGDPTGDLALAFLLAEVVTELEAQNNFAAVKDLNKQFRRFHRADHHARGQAAQPLKALLERLAHDYPDLESRSADLQSRIDESVRSLARL